MRCLIPKLDDFADAYEISTHYVGKDLAPMEKTMTMLRELTDKPVYMKVSPHFPDPVAFAQMVMEHGGNGIVAINSVGPCMKIDLESRSVPIGNANGQVWLSGPAIKPIALALVNQIKAQYRNVKLSVWAEWRLQRMYWSFCWREPMPWKFCLRRYYREEACIQK